MHRTNQKQLKFYIIENYKDNNSKSPINYSLMVSISTSSFNDWPLTSYVKLRVAHAPGMPGTFSPTPT